MEQKKKKTPERQCMGCNERFPKNALLRVVRDPDGNVCLDFTGKKSGRGAYICHSAECYKKAVEAKRVERSFSVAIPESVTEQILKELESAE